MGLLQTGESGESWWECSQWSKVRLSMSELSLVAVMLRSDSTDRMGFKYVQQKSLAAMWFNGIYVVEARELPLHF